MGELTFLNQSMNTLCEIKMWVASWCGRKGIGFRVFAGGVGGGGALVHFYSTYYVISLQSQRGTRKADIRLARKGDLNSRDARPVHLIISMIKWIRTSGSSIKNSLSLSIRVVITL